MKKLLTEQMSVSDFTLVESDRSKLPKNVLMRVEGQIGLYDQPTLNGRTYTRTLWEKVLKSENITGKFRDRNLFGEADHPQDLEVAIQRVSHAIPKFWLDESSNKIMGVVDVLDTPAGRIVATLMEYGKVGMSSRGAGELVERGGTTMVDEDNYDFVTFDFVTDPANVGSYPRPVHESMAQVARQYLREDSKGEHRAYYTNLFEKVGVDLTTLQNESDAQFHEDSRAALLETRMDEMVTTLGDLTKSLKGRDEALVVKDTQIIALQETIASLQARLSNANTLLEQAKKAQQVSTQDTTVLAEQLNTIEGMVKEGMSKGTRNVVELQGEIAKLQSQIKEQTETSKRLESELSSLKERHAKMRTRLMETRTSLAQTKAQLEESRRVKRQPSSSRVSKTPEQAPVSRLRERAKPRVSTPDTGLMERVQHMVQHTGFTGK